MALTALTVEPNAGTQFRSLGGTCPVGHSQITFSVSIGRMTVDPRARVTVVEGRFR